MSLNQIVKDDFKFWLDPYVNSIKVDNEWEYKESDKTVGDYLILNPSLIAEWNPTIPNLTGNVICCRIQQGTVISSYSTRNLQPYINFSPYFTLSNSFVNIVEAGTYIVYTCANISSSLNAEMFSRVVLEVSPNTFQEVIGSQISIPAGCTIFASNPPVSQSTNMCTTSLITTTNPNSRVGIQLRSTLSATIENAYSYFIVQKIK